MNNQRAGKCVLYKYLLFGCSLLAIAWASSFTHAEGVDGVMSDNYCASSGGGSEEWITSVTLADLNQISAQSDYSDNSHLVANVNLGNNQIVLQPGFRSSIYNEHWTVFIDFNVDGDFDDDGERVLQAFGSGAIEETLYIPLSATGVTTRMRVSMRYGNPVINPCSNISHGEIEDYTIAISGDTAIEPPLTDIPNACLNEVAFLGSKLVEGDAICLANGRQTFAISVDDTVSSIAVSTSHGNGNLTLFAKSGQRPETDFSDPYSKHVGNDECIILEQPEGSWSYFEVNGTHVDTSLIVDFNRLTCRVTPGEIEELKSNYGNDGYPYNSVNIKVFRFEFSDTPFDWDDTEMRAEFDKMVQFYTDTSYGQFTVSYDMSQPIIKIDQPKSEYDNNFHKWKAAWQAAILAESGIDPKNPGQQTVVLMAAPKVGSFNSSAAPPSITLYHKEGGVIAHELGHALGLRHGYALEGGTKVIGAGIDAAIESTNYGGLFSLMGKGSRSYESFDLMHKQYFSWITDADVPLVNQTGIYRIYAFDQGSTTGHNAPGIIGLRLQSGAEEDYIYWLEYRTSNERYENTRNGVLVYLQGFLETEQDASFWKHKSHLLDMTPDSNTPGEEDWWGNDQIDSELAVGKSYTDKWGAFTIEVLNKGGTIGTANAWIDVKVTIN